MTEPRIIVALDFPVAEQAIAVARQLPPDLCRVKVGLELFVAAGPAIIGQLTELGHEVFLDLKFHDIPNTVAGACRAAAATGAWMINVHALGGQAMLAAAREALGGSGHRPLLIAVTILTSHSRTELQGIGLPGAPAKHVQVLAAMARDSGLDGIVCSPHEAQAMRQAHGRDFLLVTPGVRPAGAARHDQQRTMTPAQAVAAGSDYLVIGRPITGAPDPAAALAAIQQGLVQA